MSPEVERTPPMPGRTLALPEDADKVERLSRLLAQSVNARVLALLMERRARGTPEDDDVERPEGQGWMFLSEIAGEVGEAPGTVGSSLQKLLPLLEERRVKGRRFFRSSVLSLAIEIEESEESFL